MRTNVDGSASATSPLTSSLKLSSVSTNTGRIAQSYLYASPADVRRGFRQAR
jgi:hypothetical protein